MTPRKVRWLLYGITFFVYAILAVGDYRDHDTAWFWADISLGVFVLVGLVIIFHYFGKKASEKRST